MCFVNAAIADSNSLTLSVPTPSQNYQTDRIRSGELDCSNAIGGATNIEFGVTGLIGVERDPLSPNYGDRAKDIGVYARMTIPLDGPRERINCNTLYMMELEKKRIEVEKLRQELNNMKKLQFEK